MSCSISFFFLLCFYLTSTAGAAIHVVSAERHNAIGTQLLSAGRTLGAQRHFSKAQILADDTCDAAWDARINEALCIVCLAEAPRSRAAWLSQLPKARCLIWSCIVTSPSQSQLLSLFTRARAADGGNEQKQWRRTIEKFSAIHQHAGGDAIARSWSLPTVSAATHGETLIIAFAGADAHLGGGAAGGVPSHEFVASCRRAGVGRAIFVRDVLRAWYTRGIGGAHERRFEGMVGALRHEIRALQPSRVVTIGSSMGGYAAVRAGVELGADMAVAFAPQGVIDRDARNALALPPAPFDELLTTLGAVSAAADIPLPSLSEVVEAAPSGCKTAIELHVGANDEGDVREARLLLGATERHGLPSLACSLHVYPDRGHNLVTQMRDDGELDDLLKRLAAPVGGRPGATISSFAPHASHVFKHQ
jgi:hypothetical protein